VSRISRNNSQREIEDLFSKFGKIRMVTLKYNYCFVDFEDHAAAVAAIQETDGKELLGEIIQV